MGLIIKGTMPVFPPWLPYDTPTIHWLLQELDSRSAESTQSREISSGDLHMISLDEQIVVVVMIIEV